jgi:hypothetical protein
VNARSTAPPSKPRTSGQPEVLGPWVSATGRTQPAARDVGFPTPGGFAMRDLATRNSALRQRRPLGNGPTALRLRGDNPASELDTGVTAERLLTVPRLGLDRGCRAHACRVPAVVR